MPYPKTLFIKNDLEVLWPRHVDFSRSPQYLFFLCFYVNFESTSSNTAYFFSDSPVLPFFYFHKTSFQYCHFKGFQIQGYLAIVTNYEQMNKKFRFEYSNLSLIKVGYSLIKQFKKLKR